MYTTVYSCRAQNIACRSWFYSTTLFFPHSNYFSLFLSLHYILVVRDLVTMSLFCILLIMNESGHFPWCFSRATILIAFVRLLSNSRVAYLLFPVRLKDDFILTFLCWLYDTVNKLLLSCSRLLVNIFHWDCHIINICSLHFQLNCFLSLWPYSCKLARSSLSPNTFTFIIHPKKDYNSL